MASNELNKGFKYARSKPALGTLSASIKVATVPCQSDEWVKVS